MANRDTQASRPELGVATHVRTKQVRFHRKQTEVPDNRDRRHVPCGAHGMEAIRRCAQ